MKITERLAAVRQHIMACQRLGVPAPRDAVQFQNLLTTLYTNRNKSSLSRAERKRLKNKARRAIQAYDLKGKDE